MIACLLCIYYPLITTYIWYIFTGQYYDIIFKLVFTILTNVIFYIKLNAYSSININALVHCAQYFNAILLYILCILNILLINFDAYNAY